MTFQFNGNYRDQEQVAPYLDAFSVVHAEIAASGQYTYNSLFKGRIAGLDAATSKDEDTAIYMLQCMHAIRAEHQVIEQLRADGYRDVAALPKSTRFRSVVVYRAGHFVGGTGWTAKYTDVRIVPDAEGVPYGLIEKGKRKYGHALTGARVLARD